MRKSEQPSSLDKAAEWYFRREGGALPPADEAEFRQWMSLSENVTAYEEIERTWSDLGTIPRPIIAEEKPRQIRPARSRLRQHAIAAAAAVVLVFGVGYGLDLPMRLRADAYTAAGQTRSIALSDGSSVVLNTATAVSIDYSGAERRVRLLRGEALFTVAKDQARPFLVESENGEARALGTAFAVRREPDGVTVTVLENRVGVSFPAGERFIELAPGEAVRYSRAGIGTVRPVDADAETAWQRGKLIFVDKPLGDVVSELNRYHAGRIQITDGSIGNHPVSGVFDTRDPIRALDSIEAALNLHSTRLTSLLILLHR